MPRYTGIRHQRVPSSIRIQIAPTQPDLPHLQQYLTLAAPRLRYILHTRLARTLQHNRLHLITPANSRSYRTTRPRSDLPVVSLPKSARVPILLSTGLPCPTPSCKSILATTSL